MPRQSVKERISLPLRRTGFSLRSFTVSIFIVFGCSASPRSLREPPMSDGWGGRAVIAFGTQPGPRLVRNGVELRPNSISQLSPGQSYYQHSSGQSSYGTMSLPLEEFASLSVAIAGRELRPPDVATSITPTPVAMAKLQSLHAAAGVLAEEAPTVLGKHFSIAVVSCQASSSPFVHFPTVIVHRLARFSLLSEVGAMAAT